jgi:hypothetical protein
MGKYIGYVLLIIVVVFLLEWFEVVDVPFFEIPDFFSGKKDVVDSTKDVLDKME